MSELLRSTLCRTKEFMLSLFVSHIRPIMDYCSCVWNVGYLSDIRLLEGLQRRWTREIEGVGHQQYSVRLREIGLFSVAGRFLRVDLVKVWKAFHSPIEVGLSSLFEMAQYAGTRGHPYKLAIPRCRTEIRRRFFGVRCVNIWNGLSRETVECENLLSFKKMLDRELGDKLFHTY